ncbi:hypothetical protein MQV54_001476 [Campylobacter jejuni]|nr:hypothetical protein [Campylobacter jejuni]
MKISNIKKSFLAFSFLILSSTSYAFYEPNDKNFKDGFEAGLEALKFQAQIDGFSYKKIEINKPYLIVYNIENIPLNEALFLQVISSREGYESHLTKEFITFGEFEREIDAKEKIKFLISKFKLNAKDFKIQKNIKEIITYPYLYKRFYEKLLDEAKASGVIVETKIIEKNPIKQIKSSNKPKSIPKKSYEIFTLNNTKAMSYYSLGGSEKDSKNYIEKGFVKSGKEYEIEKNITTNSGEKFVKIVGENIYFSIKDIAIKNKKAKNEKNNCCNM